MSSDPHSICQRVCTLGYKVYGGLSLGAFAMHSFRGIGSSSSAVYSLRDLGHKEIPSSHHEFENVTCFRSHPVIKSCYTWSGVTTTVLSLAHAHILSISGLIRKGRTISAGFFFPSLIGKLTFRNFLEELINQLTPWLYKFWNVQVVFKIVSGSNSRSTGHV